MASETPPVASGSVQVLPLPQQSYLLNPIDGMPLVYIPAGEFLMGSDPQTDPYFYGAEAPSHNVYLDGYWIYQTEVTNAMYRACAGAQACPRPVNSGSDTREDYFGNPAFDDYPVVYVSWRHASAYCRWAGGRLPTEAEWEKAGRGTDGRLFPWGNEPPSPGMAQYGTGDTAAVGSYPAGVSPYGVLDMSGNVIEWVADYFQSTYYSASPYENPLGPATGDRRVYRSGSYHNMDPALRVVMRGSRDESHANVDIGFRCVVDEATAAEIGINPELGIVTATQAASAPQGFQSTQIILFQPSRYAGQELIGSCWTMSIATPREGAWRCMSDSQIFDPCFSPPGESGYVICGTAPPDDSPGFRLNLTQPLPQETHPDQIINVLLLELEDGTTCSFLSTGTRFSIERQFFDYGCTDGSVLLGELVKGDIWTATKARISADMSSIEETSIVNIRIVWR